MHRLTRSIFRLVVLLTAVVAFPALAGVGGGSHTQSHVVGGVGVDAITGMAVAANGDVVVCGYTSSGEASTVPGLYRNPSGLNDAFVAVLSADLTKLKYWTYYGGGEDDIATGVGVMPNGTIVVTGETTNPNFSMSSGAFAQLYGGQIDGYIVRFSSDLDSLLFGTYIPGAKDEHPTALIVDDAGFVYVCGYTNSPTGFLTTNGYDRSHNGGIDGFALKMSPSGGSLSFSTYFGGGGDDYFKAMTITGDGGLALTGYTTNSTYEVYPVPSPWDWPPNPDKPYDRTFNGGQTDAVITILSGDGASVITSGFFGGDGDDYGNAIQVDIRNDLFLAGSTTSTDLPTSLALQPSKNAGADAFMTRLSPKGSSLLASTYLGGGGNDAILSAIETTNNRWYLMGTTSSRDLQAEGGGTSSSVGGTNDLFIAHASIAEMSYLTTFGWGGTETGSAFAVDAKRDLYIGGTTNSSTISWSGGSAANEGPANSYEGFVSKWAFGTVDLVNPRGDERLCVSENFNVTWSTLDLSNDEQFDLEISADGTTWTPAASKLKGRSYQWSVPPSLQLNTDYLMRVKSSHGHISTSSGTFSLLAPAAIVTAPVAQHVCQGATVTLNVNASGDGLSYQWKRNGAIVPNATASQLQLTNIQTTKAGTYEVVVSNECGSVTSAAVQVDVDADVVINKQPADKVINQGQTLLLEVQAKGLDLRYEWSRNGQVIVGETSNTLEIQSVTVDHAGDYRVTINGSCGNDTSRVAKVEVTTLPLSVEDPAPATFSIAPNPTSGIATVVIAKPTSVVVLDMAGRVVYAVPGNGEVAYPAHVQLNLEALAVGTYIVVADGTSRLLTIVR